MSIKEFFRNYGRRRIVILLIFLSAVSLLNMRTFDSMTRTQDHETERNTHDIIGSRYTLNSSEILNFIELTNSEEKIINLDTFGQIEADTMIIVILLERFSIGFESVVLSLSNVTGIEKALLVFSHSYYDDKLNSIISKINFCRVLQIYYPYSVQTHPKQFPGYGPSDCINRANRENCNSLFFDKHGRFRSRLFAKRKHHWWWTVNTVFENLKQTANHKGLVVFSQDNYVFMKDFIYTALFMKDVANSLPQCEFLSFGSDIIPESNQLGFTQLFSLNLTSWSPKKHSRVLAFDIKVWNSIVSHYDVFCTLENESWLDTLYYISMNRRDGKRFKAISAVAPRVYNIGTWNCWNWVFYCPCNTTANFLRVTKLQNAVENLMFSPFFQLYVDVELEDDNIVFEVSKSDGGWVDPRDWALCRNMTTGKLKQIITELRRNI